MYLRSTKKIGAEVYLEDTIGKDKDDNAVTLQEVLENDDKSVEEQVNLKFQIKKLYSKMKELLKDRERVILELRFGLDGNKPKTQNQIAKMMGISRSYVLSTFKNTYHEKLINKGILNSTNYKKQ